jgi:hypothetical protein
VLHDLRSLSCHCPGPLGAFTWPWRFVSHSGSGFYGAFVWARRARDSPNWPVLLDVDGTVYQTLDAKVCTAIGGDVTLITPACGVWMTTGGAYRGA